LGHNLQKLIIMKKIIALSTLALTVCFATGQTSKNSWLIGGTIGLTSSTQKESDAPGSSKATVFQLAPGVGYFFADNLAAGINLNLSTVHNSSDGSGSYGGYSSTGTTFTAGPFVRYYFSVAPQVKLFVHTDASWGSSKVSSSYAGTGTNDNPPGAPISMYEGKAGAAFFLNPTVALEVTAGYQSMTEKDNSGPATIKYTTGSMIIGVGFQIYLGPTKNKK
jgi:hypothetical protein